jgi:hypothetical protein
MTLVNIEVLVDEEKVLYTLLNDNWNALNVMKPLLAYDDKTKTAEARQAVVRIYYSYSPEIRPHGLGYLTKEVRHYLTLDIRGGTRDIVLKTREEIVRILDLKRVRPATDYDWLEYSSGYKIANYANFYRYIMTVQLVQIRRSVGTL